MFSKIRTPERIFVEGVSKRGKPEIQDGELRAGLRLAESSREAAGYEDHADGWLRLENFGHDTRFVLMSKKKSTRTGMGIPGQPLVRHQSSSSAMKHCSHAKAPRASPRYTNSRSKTLRSPSIDLATFEAWRKS